MELYCQGWWPEGEVRGVVAMVHGVGEHSGRFGNVVSALTAHGYVVVGYDHRGFGHSPGQRGHINDWSEYREDLDAFLERASGVAESMPLFVYGHSMGALVVLDYLQQSPSTLRGAVISGAPIEPGSVADPRKVTLARGLSRLAPRFPFTLGLDASALSRDPEFGKAYEKDPLTTPSVTVRWGAENLDTISRVRKHAGDIVTPVLFVHGEADRLNLVRGLRPFVDAIPIADKALRVYPGVCHEPHNDPDHERVLTDVAEWLNGHC